MPNQDYIEQAQRKFGKEKVDKIVAMLERALRLGKNTPDGWDLFCKGLKALFELK